MMSPITWFRRSNSLLPAAVIVQALSLTRSMAVARLLGPEEFGIAAAIILFQQFFEMTTDSGLNKVLLSRRDGNRHRAQAMVQYLSIGRGLLLLAIIPAIGWVFSTQVGLPADVKILALLGISSFFTALLHYDSVRLQRVRIFSNANISLVLAELVGLLVAVGFAIVTRSYVCVPLGILARAIALTAVSHAVARRPYRARWDETLAKPLWRFCWPLVLNGLVLFAAGQADRLLVATSVSLREFGIYAAALVLISAPSIIATRVLGSYYLPELAHASHDLERFRSIERPFSELVTAAAALMVLGFSCVGPWAIGMIYGQAYATSGVIVALIASLYGMRFARTAPGTVALALGRTRVVLLSNMTRLGVLAFGIGSLWISRGLAPLLVALVIGEAVSLMATQLMLNRSIGRAFVTGLSALLPIFAASALGIIGLQVAGDRFVWVLAFVTGIGTWWMVRKHRDALWDLLRHPPIEDRETA